MRISITRHARYLHLILWKFLSAYLVGRHHIRLVGVFGQEADYYSSLNSFGRNGHQDGMYH
jgi:hypothetical protein